MSHEIVLVGLSHHTAPVEIRERVAFGNGYIDTALRGLVALPAVSEGVIVSTCNRVEIVATGPSADEVAASLPDFIAAAHGVGRETLAGRFDLIANRARERPHHTLEDTFAVKAVCSREVDRTIHLEDHPLTVALRKQVDSYEVGSERRRRSERDLAGSPRRLHVGAHAPEGNVRSPLPAGGNPVDGAYDLACRDEDAQVVATGLDELLDERPLPPEPRPP